jgi:hypothetical protein
MTTRDLTKAAADTGDPSKLLELEGRFEKLQAARAAAVADARKASIAQAQAEISARQLQQETADFMLFAGQMDRVVAVEGVWPTPPFKNESGAVILETPFSSRDARTATRVMHSKLAEEAKHLETRFSNLFEAEQDDETETE